MNYELRITKIKNIFYKTVMIVVFSLILNLCFVLYVQAASLDLNVEKNTLQTGEIFTLTISLNTEGESINTIEGDLKYNELFLKAEVINIGGSFVSFWVEKPDLRTSGVIHFSGIVPGGISTAESEVFKVIFRAETKGDANLFLNNVHLFLNNGLGSEIAAKTSNQSVKITQGTNGTGKNIVSTDTIPPEKFVIIRTRDQSIYDNEYFVVFSTLDKDSGMDYYEVCELFKCVSAESPFLLWNKTPFYHIVVRAYDMNGNIRESTLISPYLILLLFIIILLPIFIYLYRRYLHSYRV